MNRQTRWVMDLSLLTDGVLEPSDLNFRPYNDLIDEAADTLGAQLPELTDGQLHKILLNLDTYTEFLESCRVPKGWARRKLFRLSINSVIFGAGLIGTTLVALPLGYIGWLAIGGSGISLSYDIGDIAYKHSIQTSVLTTLAQIDTLVDLVSAEVDRRANADDF